MSYYIKPQHNGVYFLQLLEDNPWEISYELIGLRHFQFEWKKPRFGAWWFDKQSYDGDVEFTIPIRTVLIEGEEEKEKRCDMATVKNHRMFRTTTITTGPSVSCFNPEVFKKSAGLVWRRGNPWFIAVPSVFRFENIVFFDGLRVAVTRCRYPNKAEADRILEYCGVRAERMSIEEINQWCSEMEADHDHLNEDREVYGFPFIEEDEEKEEALAFARFV